MAEDRLQKEEGGRKKEEVRGISFISSFLLSPPSFMRAVLHALAFTFIFCGSAYAVEASKKPVEITAKVDREKVNVGDRITLELRARNASGMDVWFPDKPENLGDFSLFSSSPAKDKPGKTADPGHVYILGVYSTGTHVILPVQVRYRPGADSEWSVISSPQVPIEVETLLTGAYTDIMDLKGIVPFRTGFALRSVVITLLLALAGLGVYIWRRGKMPFLRKEAEPPKSPHEIAYEELRRLKAMDLPGKGQVKEYYIRLSDIIRRYIENRFFLRAPEMTTEEFLESIKDSPEMRDEHGKLLKVFLSHCDMVKFAKYGPTPLEMMDSFKSAERLVDETKAVEAEEVKA